MSRKKRRIRKGLIPVVGLLLAAAVLACIFLLNKWQIIITPAGGDIVYTEYGEPYEDEGATAMYSGTLIPFLTKEVEVTSSGTVDTNTLGSYEITYHAESGNVIADHVQTVVVCDRVPPVITLTADPEYYTPYGHEYTEEGFTAADNHDGELSEKVQRTVRENTVMYMVTDSSGNGSLTERTIVYDDRRGPEISLASGEEVSLYTGDGFDGGYSAEDDVDGDVTAAVQVDGGVDPETPGDYTLTYTVTDEHGNETVVTQTVHVKNRPVNTGSAEETSKTIYLTFDDGPGPYTEELLGILDRYNVKATFFTTSAYPGYSYCIGLEAAAGHTVAVHTTTHNYAQIYSSTEAYWDDFNYQNSIIESQTGFRSNMFRFPGGSSNTVSASYCPGIMTTLVSQAADRGYVYFDWNVSSGDAGGTTDSDQVYYNVIGGIEAASAAGKPSIVLQHDVKPYSVNAVARIIEWGLENGYTFSALNPGSYTSHHGVNN